MTEKLLVTQIFDDPYSRSFEENDNKFILRTCNSPITSLSESPTSTCSYLDPRPIGYPDARFETALSENLHCTICSCVLNDPVMCKNEDCFCRGCISKHLENDDTCPTCNDELTVESLANAPLILRKLLSEQRIRCDHHDRGCQEIVQLGNLASHVAVCGKAPVVCANEECSSEINREDQARHESEECRFRKVKCRNCKEMHTMVQGIEARLDGLCTNVKNLNTSVDEMKTGLAQIENRFETGGNQSLNADRQREEVDNEINTARSDHATKVDPGSDFSDKKIPTEHAYVVAGGFGYHGNLLNSVEIFDKTNNSWIELQPMKKCRADASSVVYNGQVLVTGGTPNGENILSSMEQLNHNPNQFVPPFWSTFPVNLPQALAGHRSVVYNDKMLIIGCYGHTGSENVIYEIQLKFPFTTKILAKLPSSIPVNGCGVTLANDKILIFGGVHYNLATDKVTMYDITNNEFKELAPLPYKVCHMATVKYEGNVILACGSDRNCYSNAYVRNTIIKYNVETQRSTMVPPVRLRRSRCCAIVDGHSLVVMGGSSYNGVPIDLVRKTDLRSPAWECLPSLKTARKEFIAAVV